MTVLLQYLVFVVLIWPLTPTGAFPQSGLHSGDSRTRRGIHCREGSEYQEGNICCLNCPAGTRKTSGCTSAGEQGRCEECDDGTYTEHSNGEKHCFKCEQCGPDKEIVRPCTHTQNVECRCKLGRFCDPDDACEVCKKCSRCGKDEEIVRNCTPTTNTECKKIQPSDVSASAKASVIVPLVLFPALVTAVIIGFVCIRRRLKAADSPGNLPDGLRAGQPYSPSEERSDGQTLSCSNLILPRQLVRTKSFAGTEDERKVLCESLNSSASNSQHSLTGLPSSAFPAPPPRASLVVSMQPDRRDNEPFPELIPTNGEESLRGCFQHFEEIDCDHYKRFFRHLGINDNVIKSKDSLLYEDRIHELLNVWVEKMGREATINDLLKALLYLNQRRTAETIKDKAVDSGQYFVNENEK